MNDIAIKVESLYKQYKLGTVTTGTISHDLNRWWHKIQGKEDPYQKITGVNDRTKKTSEEYVWALNNINFEVKKGDVLGIVGKNGAGKSTLLKILSKVTSPTKGNIKVNGRIASLLEVGTGFHPELSGRENIYLNGAILGMTKSEITRKFDEIVDFSGVGKYIDTPVKRYSSGMYVRLAFAVAAHLESEVLIVDEVLAVGDAEFQKKCLGKMKDVSSGEGRTVLFVSHDMQAISTLTKKLLYIKNGSIEFDGGTEEGINRYLSDSKTTELSYSKPPKNDAPSITNVSLVTSLPNNVQENGKEMKILFTINMPKGEENMALAYHICDIKGKQIVHGWIYDTEQPILRKAGLNVLCCVIPNLKLYMGKYYFIVHFAQFGRLEKFDTITEICPFEVVLYSRSREYNWTEGACTYLEDTIWYQYD